MEDFRSYASREPSPPEFLHPDSPWRTPPEEGKGRETVLAGVRFYQERTAPLVRPLLAGLAAGQQPRAFCVSCVDSRVLPDLLTASGPGDLLTLRNVGNVVPPYDATHLPADLSVPAAVEFAVSILRVPAIVVCGHSGCAGLQALHQGTDLGRDAGTLRAWLRLAEPSLARWAAGDPVRDVAAREGWADLDQIVMVNVVEQLDHLMSYPLVADAVASGQTQLVGLYLDIATARVLVYEPADHRFVPVTDKDLH
ncbi:carbonic anhydrase [Actinopolymorpha alba]|uniref:carbonic anhydrase n=1 Tax=Actinopolymorpha alba TaxID=533267 RepID=UPI0003A8D96F|nr:carbonic anhydrase [Actinopolymorpha alba]